MYLQSRCVLPDTNTTRLITQYIHPPPNTPRRKNRRVAIGTKRRTVVHCVQHDEDDQRKTSAPRHVMMIISIPLTFSPRSSPFVLTRFVLLDGVGEYEFASYTRKLLVHTHNTHDKVRWRNVQHIGSLTMTYGPSQESLASRFILWTTRGWKNMQGFILYCYQQTDELSNLQICGFD